MPYPVLLSGSQIQMPGMANHPHTHFKKKKDKKKNPIYMVEGVK